MKSAHLEIGALFCLMLFGLSKWACPSYVYTKWLNLKETILKLQYFIITILYQLIPTRQDVDGRWEDALPWARMKVFRTSLFVADVDKTLRRRRVRIGRSYYVLRTPGRKRTPWKLSYGPKVGHPLNVTSESDVLWTTLAEWVIAQFISIIYIFIAL